MNIDHIVLIEYVNIKGMNIREATSEDLGAIINLNHKLCVKENREFDETINPDYSKSPIGEKGFANLIKGDDSIIFVAEDSGKVIGYIAAVINNAEDFRKIEKIGEGASMWVDEEYRSRGIGKEFLKQLEDWLISKGVKRMRIVASAGNEKAIKFYKREGYEEYDLTLEKDI